MEYIDINLVSRELSTVQNLSIKDRAMNFSEYHENKFYDCVSMKLHGEIVTEKPKHENYSSNLILSPQAQIDELKNKEIDLQLTIRFNEHEFIIDRISNKNIKFGIQYGKLKLKLINCIMPLETYKMVPEFQPIIEVEVSEEENFEQDSTKELSFKGGLKREDKSSQKTSTKFKDFFLKLI